MTRFRVFVSQRVWRRGLGLCLALCLLIALPFAASAAGTVLLPSYDSPQGGVFVARDGDGLVILRAEGLYRWQAGEDKPALTADFGDRGFDGAGGKLPFVSDFVVLDGTPCLVYGSTGPFYRFDEKTGVFTLFAERAEEEPTGQWLIRQHFADGADIYAMAVDPAEGVSSLVRLSFEGKAPETVKHGILLAAPYKPGELLVVHDQRMAGSGLSLGVLTLQNSSYTNKQDLAGDVRALKYDQQTDTAYLLKKGAVDKAVGFAAPVPHMTLPFDLDVRQAVLVGDGTFAFPLEDGSLVLHSPPAAGDERQELSVLGHLWDLPMAGFELANPDVSIKTQDSYPDNTTELTVHMMSGASAADVYVLYASQYDLAALAAKGWYYDLGQDPALRAAADGLYPFIKAHLLSDDKVLALPFYLQSNAMAAVPGAWQTVGLTDQDSPQTYQDMLHLVDRFSGELAAAHPEISFFEQGAEGKVYKMVLLNNILSQWRLGCLSRGEPVRYEPLRDLIQQLLNTDFSQIGGPSADMAEWAPNRQLFEIHADPNPGQPGGQVRRFVPLSVLPDVEPVIPADATMLLVNPYTTRPELALNFVRYVMDHLNPGQTVCLYPEENEPVKNPHFMPDTWLAQNLTLAEEALKKAQGGDIAELQAQVDQAKEAIRLHERYQWLVGEEAIKTYRGLDRYLMLRVADREMAQSPTAQSAMPRLLEGQITLDQFIRESDEAESLRERE